MSDRITGYEISWHAGHRPEHTFGGRQFTFEEMETQGIADMLDEPNCRHRKFPVIVGVTPPQYSEAELARFAELEQVKHEYRGKEYTLYELRQRLNRYIKKLKILNFA